MLWVLSSALILLGLAGTVLPLLGLALYHAFAEAATPAEARALQLAFART